MRFRRKIEILEEQQKKTDDSNWNFKVWYSETLNLLDLIFENSERKAKQLRNVFTRPGYNIMGVDSERAKIECNQLLDGFINEIKIKNEFNSEIENNIIEYVNSQRIDELAMIKSNQFDFTKLIALCQELNSNFQSQNYLSVAILVRAIVDHIPPIFGFPNFKSVANNAVGKSFKHNLIHLENSMRNVADSFLHQTVRQKEVLPNKTQVDFRADLDTLLSEVVRINKELNYNSER